MDRKDKRRAGSRSVSVIIPAHNEAALIGQVVSALRCQQPSDAELEVLVIDDASTDGTARIAREAGATVLSLADFGERANPAAARNRAATRATGEILVFLDADCIVADGWLDALLGAFDRGEVAVGGSLALPPGLPYVARCDYYCGWYLIHPRAEPGYVPHHPPPNLAVRADVFRSTSGFEERQPHAYTGEERFWQGELLRRGQRIWFEPRAVAFHHNRPGFVNLLRRNYRWAYSTVEGKSVSGASRGQWLYQRPRLLIALAGPFAVAHSVFIIGCWLRAGVLEPLLMLPAILASRVAYATGMVVGGVRWLRQQPGRAPLPLPRSP